MCEKKNDYDVLRPKWDICIIPILLKLKRSLRRRKRRRGEGNREGGGEGRRNILRT